MSPPAYACITNSIFLCKRIYSKSG